MEQVGEEDLTLGTLLITRPIIGDVRVSLVRRVEANRPSSEGDPGAIDVV